MIITDLLAENFRKYDKLHLENLPDKGLIVITGNNESGKSSVGDAICFVLYGRTDKLTGERIGKLVRWGKDAVKITISFSEKGKNYRLTRMADKAGVQTASLWSVDEGRTLADTTEEVADAVRDLLGYGYPAFMRTFYWSQRVSEDSNADTDSLQAMAGVKSYIKLDDELRKEYSQEALTLKEHESELETALEARDGLGVDKEILPKLLDMRETLEGRQQGSLALTQNIASVRENYTENHGLFHRFNSWSRKIGWLATLGIVLLLIALLLWAVVTFMPQLLESVWPDGLQNTEATGRGLLWLGVIFAILTALLMLYGWHIERNKLRPLRDESVVLASALQDGSEQLNSNMRDYIGVEAEDYLTKRSLLSQNEKVGADWQSDPEKLRSLSEDIRTYEADPLETIAAADGVSMALEKQNGKLERFVEAVDEDVVGERERVEHYMTMNAEVQKHEDIVTTGRRQLKVKKKGLELVHKAARHAISNFNNIVHNRCSGLLSDFTQSNYKNLEIDTDFTLRVLSEEKGDYLEFDEASAGTQRQIALAMRIALANTLAESAGADGQFMFLDEPFAFFDGERTSATINSLSNATDDNLKQIWVTLQERPKNLKGAFIVDCRQGSPVLEASG